MTIETTRRGFLKFLGIGAAAAIIEEPVRKLWFVGSNAPVGSRVEPAWTIDAAAQRLYEACGKPFPLPDWNGGYRSSDFPAYLDHIAKAAEMTMADVNARREMLEHIANQEQAYKSVNPGRPYGTAGMLETIRLLKTRGHIDDKAARELLFGDYALAGNG